MSDTQVTVMRVLSETVLTLPRARAAIQESTGLRPDKSTLTRWILRGRSGVKLEAVKVGIQWVTSSEAITRFLIATTEKATS